MVRIIGAYIGIHMNQPYTHNIDGENKRFETMSVNPLRTRNNSQTNCEAKPHQSIDGLNPVLLCSPLRCMHCVPKRDSQLIDIATYFH